MSVSDPDARARAVEEQMTDDERFALLVSVMGTNAVNPVRDSRIPVGHADERGVRPRHPAAGCAAAAHE
jgi:beta-glucosidase